MSRTDTAGGEASHDQPTQQELVDLIEKADVSGLEKWGGAIGLARALGTDPVNGLHVATEDDLIARRKKFGSNDLPEPAPTPLWRFVVEAFLDPIIILLTVCAIISLILGVAVPRKGEESSGWIDGFAILVAVTVVTAVSSSQNYSKELKFRALNKVKNDRAVKVWRNGEPDVVLIDTIVVGDIIELSQGDYVPADGVYISGDCLAVDESAMTGEPEAIRKSERKPFMLSGCAVAEGQGLFIVTGVGVHSEWGQLYVSLGRQEPEQTPLEEMLEGLAQFIGYIAFAVAILLFTVLGCFWLMDAASGKRPDPRLWLDYLIQSIAIIAVAVPEGLPLAVTISLAYSMSSMLKDNNLVRKLSACETMGGATQICSDKTGTLTQNRMTVTQFWGGGKLIRGRESFEDSVFKSAPRLLLRLFAQGVSVNSTAFLKVDREVHDESGTTHLQFIGSKTECALLVMARHLGYEYADIREKHKSQAHTIPFSSDRKRMSTVIMGKKGTILHCKGASEIILDLCTTFIDGDGNVSSLSSELKQQLNSEITMMAQDGLRTLAIAYRVFGNGDFDTEHFGEADEEQMTLIALVGITDPLRPEVVDAIKDCRRAGVTVRMVTGDNVLTAVKIASDCGIFRKMEGHMAIEGPEFRSMSDEALGKVIDKVTVLARSKPNDKLRLVKFLKARGEVVAVTGDGTNDSPALKAADIGMAMGVAGTEIAKEASDIIIMDDNFASIVAALKWGRNVRFSIQKFLQFQITVSMAALVVAFVGGVTGYGEPLRPVQLLWVNLQMDSLAALALATDYPSESVLDQPPAGRERRLITGAMWRNIICAATWQLVIILAIMYGDFWGGLIQEDPEPLCQTTSINGMTASNAVCPPRDAKTTRFPTVRYTFLFNVFVWLQFFNEINSRRINEMNVFEGFFSNKIFVGVLVLTALFQVVFVELGGPAMGVTPKGLSADLWGLSLIFGASILVAGFIWRRLPVWEPDWMIYNRKALKDTESAAADINLETTNEGAPIGKAEDDTL